MNREKETVSSLLLVVIMNVLNSFCKVRFGIVNM